MTGSKTIAKILKLKGMKVTWFEFKKWNQELHIGIKPHKNGCLCPECGRRGTIINRLDECRSWLDIALLGTTVIFWYAPKEIQCSTHGRVQEEIPWAAQLSRITYRLEYRVLVCSQIMTQKAASALLKLPKSTLSDLLHRIIKRVRKGHRIRGVKTLGVDEISYLKGRKYATIVYDLDRSQVLWVGKGKGRETIDRFFNEELSQYQKLQIKWASCDMSRAYTEGIKHHCPNVRLVLDRFHIVKALNAAVDEVRKEQWRELESDGRKAIKGLRWLLYKHSNTRNKSETRVLNQLSKSNRRIHRAWVLKDEFEHFWTFKSPGAAKRFLKNWMTATLKSRIQSMRDFVATIKRHFDDIISFISRPLTNAVGEGINRIIKIVKNRASGFCNLDSFLILFF